MAKPSIHAFTMLAAVGWIWQRVMAARPSRHGDGEMARQRLLSIAKEISKLDRFISAQSANTTAIAANRHTKLDRSISAHSVNPADILAQNAILPNSETSPSLSYRESEAFFDEPDKLWTKRKERQSIEMSQQKELMASCPEGLWEKECLVGCCGEKADCKGAKFWQAHYEPSFSCLAEERIGHQGEGGKWVCDPYKIQKQDACLVYSIGSNGQYDFEESIHNNVSSKCEIHTIDMNPWSHYTTSAPPQYVKYDVYKIGPKPDTPISTLIKELGHASRTIDIFKIDCEGCEWATFKDWFGDGVYIRQVLVELHGTGGGTGAHDFFEFLFDMGYVVFHKEPNTLGCGGDCIEYAFVKLSPGFSRGESTLSSWRAAGGAVAVQGAPTCPKQS